MLKRLVIIVHRWLGVALCLLFLVWFPSGIGMMYWDFPSVTAGDRLDRSPALDPSSIRVSPAEAYGRLRQPQPPAQVRLNVYDGRPVYRFRSGRGELLVYADTGERPVVTPDSMRRAASAWTAQPAAAATITAVDVDQWTVQGTYRALQPLWKYSWADGQQAYVSETSGDVVQYTTSASRLGAYVGAIPHWFYFTPLRKHQPQWSTVVIWTSGAGAIASILGLVIGVWMYSPAKRYRRGGVPTSIPYRGQKRWHTVLGLMAGVGAVTWAFSGMLSMDPFPAPRTGPAGGRRGGAAAVAQSLRGRPPLDAFAAKDPRAALIALQPDTVKELELTSFAGTAVYLATLGRDATRIVPVDGPPQRAFDLPRLTEAARAAVSPTGAEFTTLESYDRYYLDRRQQKPLPVLVMSVHDAEQTRYYIDPKTARVTGTYSSRNWVSRWLYHGLHSLDFPWLYAHRPLWDVVMIAFMLAGTALSVTSLILAWRVLGRKIRTSIGAPEFDPRRRSDDLLAG
ncbi:MAG: hypothetical protein JWL71_3815 [Acidobacteria bacterium]|nr:hypothetical protein [Acidobacteriota bacterium]